MAPFAALACTTSKEATVTPDGATGVTPTGNQKPYVTITTLAGSDTQKGFLDGQGTTAQLVFTLVVVKTEIRIQPFQQR